MLYVEFTFSQTMEHFLACHQNAFEFFGAVPKRVMVDNLKSAVLKRTLGRAPVFNPKYLDFANHYGFDIAPCNVGKGNEKGRVENAVGYVKKNFLAGLNIADFAALTPAARLWTDTVANVRIHGETRKKPVELFENERSCLSALPVNRFDVATVSQIRASSQFRISVDGNRYSVPSRHVGHRVEVRGYAGEVRLFHKGRRVATHARLFGRGEAAYDPRHYLDLLETRPQALDNGRPFLDWQLPEVFCRARDVLRHRGEGDKEFIRILLLLQEHDTDAVARALEEALAAGTPRAGCVENILRRLLEPPAPPEAAETPQIPLLLTREPTADPGLYDARLRRGGHS